MGKLRSVATSFWSDPFIEELTPSQKLLYLYLITNDKTNMLGIYEISIRKISFDTGVDKKTIDDSFELFISKGKVKRIGNYVILVKYMKHQNFNTNMKKSAIDVYNSLPNELKDSKISVNKNNPLEGFETLLNHYGMVSKREVEYEYELEREYEEEEESKKEKFLCSISSKNELSNDHERIAFSFWELFKKNLNESGIEKTTQLDKAKLKMWSKDIRLAMEKDGRTKEEMIEIFNFLQVSDFWKPNIQSTSKLREKFERLLMEARKPRKGNGSIENDPEFVEMVNDIKTRWA